MTRPQKESALKALNKEWFQKDLPLKAGATKPVPGEGNPATDILFIGEAPGKNEDLQGRPFVGAAGKFLDELIALINLKREDVFIANIIKHRPPNNRDPLPEEVAAYTPWLAEQIRIIDPPLIVALGRYAMEYLLGPGFSITKIHGQPKRRHGRVIMPVYHPAAALYRRDWQPMLRTDFQKIPKILALIKSGKYKQAPEEAGAEAKAEKQSALL
jgi:uracil-DNA glycosylase